MTLSDDIDLERFDESPQKIPYPLRAIQKFHQTHDTKQSEECDWYTHVLGGLVRERERKHQVVATTKFHQTQIKEKLK